MRFSIIALTVLFSIFVLLVMPERELDVSPPPEGSTMRVSADDHPFAWTPQHYKIKAVEGEGNVGETPVLHMEIEKEGQTLKKIDLAIGYTPGSKTRIPQGPELSFSDGFVHSTAVYDIDYLVQYVNLGLDLVGGSELMYDIPAEAKVAASGNVQIGEILDVFRKKLDNTGMKEIYVQTMGQSRILVQLPGLKKSEVEEIKKILATQGKLEFKIVNDDPNDYQRALDYREMGIELPTPGFPYEFVYQYRKDSESGAWVQIPDSGSLVQATAAVTGSDISHAQSGFDERGGYAVNVEFTLQGAAKFGRLTQNSVGKRLAIILDGRLNSAPNIKQPILNGRCEITGGFSQAEAKQLVTVLRSGSMDIKPELVSENTVGPTLGSHSISSGLAACLLGGILVLAFMMFYYKKLGIIANFALILNLFLLIAAISFFGGTLTLPGIAGIALTIGMAVDAMILIFERMREESENKQSIKMTLSNAYSKAFITIVDSNVTTFITAFILFKVGDSGPIKGFTVTLMTGLVINLFATVFVTQTIFYYMAKRDMLKDINMLTILSKTKIPFLAMGPKVRILSYAVLIIGAIFVYQRSSEMLDVDFRGGNMLQIQLTQSMSPAQIGSACRDAGMSNVVVQSYGDEEGMAYTVRYFTDDKAEKDAFVNRLYNTLPVPKELSEAFPMDISVGSVAATEMLLWAGIALVISMFAILVYILVRFSEIKYGFAACVALIHDVAITIAVLATTGIEISLTIFAALLTVVGYSLNDTIVIFDRIRENNYLHRGRFEEIANESLNQTLSRTLLTSITTLLVILSLIFVGGGVIKGFAVTMLIGLITGTYSSIFIAVPFVNWLTKREKPEDAATTTDATDVPAPSEA